MKIAVDADGVDRIGEDDTQRRSWRAPPLSRRAPAGLQEMTMLAHVECRGRRVFVACLVGLIVGLSLGTREARAVEPCPKALRFDADGAASDLDMGWTGFAHDQAMIGASLTMAVSGCAGVARPSCGDCSISGPLPNAGGNNQRCADKPWIHCTNDASCVSAGATGPCHFFLGPPLPLAVGGVTVCMTNEISGPVTGAVNFENGSLDPSIPLLWRVFNPPPTLGCPQCVNDATPNDGVAGGTCSSGTRSGLACDANAVSTVALFGSTSLDCPSNTGQVARFAIPTVPLTSSTGTQTRTLSTANPLCRAPGFTTDRCFCDTCDNAENGVGTPCSSNADCGLRFCVGGSNADAACTVASQCPAGACRGGTTCGGRRCLAGVNQGTPCTNTSECPGSACGVGGVTTASNPCDDQTCTATVDGEGECAAGPVDLYCGPNATFVPCTNGDQADCDAAGFRSCVGGPNAGAVCTTGTQCPGGSCDIDTCSIVVSRACYPDNGALGGTVSAVGAADPPPVLSNTAHPTLGALFCMPPTLSSGANSAGGFPGIGRLVLPGTLTLAQEIVSGVAPGGGTSTTDTEANGATASDPVETEVTTPNPGTVSITEQTTTGLPPTGYRFLGEQVQITAPAATTGTPLVLKFSVDSTLFLPSDCLTQLPGLGVFKNGSPAGIGACTGAGATPNPCVASRVCLTSGLNTGDGEITVRTATASLWQLGLPSGEFALAGKTIQIKDHSDQTKRKIVVNAKDAGIVAPLVGSAGDPTCTGAAGGGATLEVTGLGPSGHSETISLPCANWKVVGHPEDDKGYAYKDKEQDQGPCRTASLKTGNALKATCTGKNPASPITYDLTPSGEGGVSVVLRTGDQGTYCAEFSSGTSATITQDDAEKFKAKDALTPGTCPSP